ncbi:hypothetical protein [Nonomuraea sp. NPDC048901]|uniref:GAP1-N2 domain-containing protein n=1 Tax=Nonomuraea sp. NPDC048901 TaxID=3155627 RepID=UPI0033DEA0BE
MAWQLHYTSAATGPSGRAGFQIVAESPGLPAGSGQQVTPYLTYRPPPNTPTAPSPERIRAMPVALSYGPVGDRYALVRCVYLGQDYSGRYGNFLGHALVLADDDLVGLRPIEFWQAPLWADTSASPGSELPELVDLMPGAALDPESLGRWLDSGGAAAYERLSILLELVRRSLVQADGRIILVSADCDEIVRWIAVLSYSLPWDAVTRLSFVTYSGDPASTAQLVVGTTPDVWIPSDVDATVVVLAEEPQPIETGRFSTTVRELWRSMDFAGIDELAGFKAADPDTAAALVALCLTGASLSAQEQAAVAELVRNGLPEWVWPLLGQRADLLGHPLAAAVAEHGPAEAAGACMARCVELALHDPELGRPRAPLPHAYRPRVTAVALTELDAVNRLDRLVGILRTAEAAGLELPAAHMERAAAALARADLADVSKQLGRTPFAWREPLLDGLVHGLERAAPDALLADLRRSPELCRLLADRDLRAAPATASAVIVWQVESGGLDRVEATVRLLSLRNAPGTWEEREQTLKAIWQAAPKADEVRRLIETGGEQVQEYPTLSGLPARLFVRVGVKSREAVDVAGRVRDAGLAGFVADDAEAVLLVTELGGVRTPVHAVREVERLTALAGRLDAELAALVRALAAKTLAGQDPAFRMVLVRELPRRSQDWLVDLWLAARPSREEQTALLEIAIRLRGHGVLISSLDEWAHGVANSRSPFAFMDSRFKKDPELHEGLRELMRSKRRGILRWGDN